MNRVDLIKKISSDLDANHDFKWCILADTENHQEGHRSTTPGGARYYESCLGEPGNISGRRYLMLSQTSGNQPATLTGTQNHLLKKSIQTSTYIDDIDRLIMKHENLHAEQSFWGEGFLDALYDIKESLLQRSSEGSDKQHYAHIRSLLETAKNRTLPLMAGTLISISKGIRKQYTNISPDPDKCQYRKIYIL